MRDFVKGLSKLLGVMLLIALVAGAILYGFFIRVVEVGHNAMAPTILAGDTVLVWRGSDVSLGEVILCPHPREAERYVMGRVVGRQGHTVELDRGAQLRINGQTPDADLRGEFEFYDVGRKRSDDMRWGIEVILDHDHPFMYAKRRPPSMRPHAVRSGVFLLSDNRSYHGEDSRSFGEVTPSNCVGRIFMRLIPGEAASPIPHGALDLIE